MPNHNTNGTEKPVCFVPRSSYPEIFHGVPSFLGVEPIRDEANLAGLDAAILGVPWEGPVTWGGPSGCELATKTIREASLRYGGYLPEFDYDFFDHLKIGDFGDVPVVHGDGELTNRHICEKVGTVLDRGAVPVTFGGDHSITVPAMKALAERHPGRVGLLHLDSHLDNMDAYGEERLARCCPLHRIYDDPNMDTTKIVHMGIRGPRNNPSQMRFAREAGATVVTGFEIKEKGIDFALQKAIEVACTDTDALYVTVCSDILDVAFNPGGPPDINGLTSYELSWLLYNLAARGVSAYDFVEIYPPTDRNNVSSHVAAWMAIYILSGMARRKMDSGA